MDPGNTRTARRRAAVACAAVACAALAGSLWIGAQELAPPVSIVFVSPEENSYASGPVNLQVRVEPGSAGVKSVSLFADGRLLCALERAPFECAWDAGPKVIEHQIRAVVTMAGGQRIARSMRTRGVAYVESVNVDVVHVTVSVTDGAGRFVRGLPRNAFRLSEDGVRQAITHFAAENVPLEIIVAVDVSGSMTDAIDQVKSAVKKFLSALRPQDRVSVIGFNDNVFTVARPAADLAARLKAVDRLAPWGGTALYDVIVQAIDQLDRQAARRVLVVFTDGEDLNSHITLSAAERRLEGSDVVMYAIGQGQARTHGELRTLLDRFAQKSGGRAFFDDVDALDATFSAILEELSNQYLLGYVPSDERKDGRWRAVKVELPGKEYRTRARQGYRATPR
ncbi:MAG: VWA domain-containing protein [Acidobacteriota bacterium]